MWPPAGLTSPALILLSITTFLESQQITFTASAAPLGQVVAAGLGQRADAQRALDGEDRVVLDDKLCVRGDRVLLFVRVERRVSRVSRAHTSDAAVDASAAAEQGSLPSRVQVRAAPRAGGQKRS